MKIVLTRSIIAAAAAAFACTALAQQPAPPAPESPQSPPTRPALPIQQQDVPDVSDSELDTFTSIYADMQVLNEDFQTELAEVDSEEEAVEIQARLQDATMELITEHGWSPDEYNQVARAINSQPDLLERALELINEKI
jgi:hypothetical protein